MANFQQKSTALWLWEETNLLYWIKCAENDKKSAET